jgi:nucleotide-binding universal stress UspA family protein
MYENILVPLDMSARAERILPHVEELAQRFNAKVIFVYVVEPVNMPVSTDADQMKITSDLIKRKTDEAEVYLASWQGEFREKGITARTRVEYGPVVETLIKVADREKADLIAMTSHGRSGLARVFYGSKTAGILQRVDRPLYLIRSRRA